MARPLAMAILLLFVHPLLDLVLLHLHPAHRTDLPSYLPQTAARDCSSWGGEGRVPLLVSLVANEPIRCDSPITGNPQTHPQQDCCRVLSTDICLPQPVGWCRSTACLTAPFLKLTVPHSEPLHKSPDKHIQKFHTSPHGI